MQLKTFRVQKFRNIKDSGEVKLLDALTCKNTHPGPDS